MSPFPNTLFTKPQVVTKRKDLRQAMPSAEVILWSMIKGKQCGVKFRRQHSVGPFIVDFFCKELNLVIEVDGPTHMETDEAEVRDRQREIYLKRYGLNVLRFTNEDIYRALDGVVARILRVIEELKPVPPKG